MSTHNDAQQKKTTYRPIFLSLLFVPTLILGILAIISSISNPSETNANGNNERENKEQSQTAEEALGETAKEEEPPPLPDGKIVYLTFDDGPSQYTAEILNILQEHDIQATFFMQGENLQAAEWKNDILRAVNEGHYIGAHSMTHHYQTLYRDEQFVPEMEETLQLIEDLTGTTPRLVRAPYGSAPGLNHPQVREHIVNGDMQLWDWTIDSMDWDLASNPQQIVTNIQNELSQDREVILMHEKIQTVQVLPQIIEVLADAGYEFVVYHPSQHFPVNFQHDDRL